MTPAQKTRKMAREIKQFYRVYLHVEDVCRRRANRSAENQPDRDIRGQYQLMAFYNTLLVDRLQVMWEKLEQWADKFPVPQQFDTPLNVETRIRLRKMMTTNNVLEDDQVDNYTVVAEPWTGPGEGLNRYERLFEVIDALADHSTIFTRRLNWWINEWEAQGSAPRERQVMSILCEEQDAIGVLRSVLADITIDVRNQKGETETTVDELRTRNRLLKRRANVAGGIQAVNRGVGIAELGGTTIPDEYEPDIDTVRDEPPLGTDIPN